MNNLKITILIVLSILMCNSSKLNAQQTGWEKFTSQGSLTAPTYSEVIIGEQTWKSMNLNVTSFKNGDPILEAKSVNDWLKAGEKGIPAYCHYDTITDNGNYYGKLYNWYAVNDSRGLCPNGWHVPSQAEWKNLDNILGGNMNTGQTMKVSLNNIVWIKYEERGGYDEIKSEKCPNCYYWTDKQKELYPCNTCKNNRYLYEKTGKFIPKTINKVKSKKSIFWDGTGESGFHAIPAGYIYENFNGLGQYTFWWCSNEVDDSHASLRGLTHDSNLLANGHELKSTGVSVRCIKD